MRNFEKGKMMNEGNSITVHDDEEGEVKAGNDRGLGWWMVLPVVVLGMLVYQIAHAAMTSVFDEGE